MQLVILTFFIHLVVSFLCLSRCKKKTSYVLELLISIFMITNQFCIVGFKEIPFSIIYYILEYIIAKIVIVFIVILMKYFSFYVAKSLVNNGTISKVCMVFFGKRHLVKLISNFKKLKYGPRLKIGIPGMAGKVHKKTGIKFDKMGFPKFKSYFTVKLKRCEYNKDREYHFYHTSKALYKEAIRNKSLRSKFTKKELEMFKDGKVPSRFTWHHHQNKGVMQLVEYKIHSDVNHIGGFSIWGKKEK